MTYKLLLVDDEVHILRATEFKLARAGFDVVCASDGMEAWESMQEVCPDMVVTDLNMPRMDGLKLVQKMRADERFENIPVIMLTAKGYEVANEVIRDEYRVAHVMTKPFSPRELLALVQSLLSSAEETAAELATTATPAGKE
ncbi:MAG: response regulator [Pirellulales bacterium]|nr:response regulator [Pirellulales bacterium]